MCVCACLWVRILPLHVRKSLMLLQGCSAAMSVSSSARRQNVLTWGHKFTFVFFFLFSLPPCYNEAAIQSTMQTSMREDVLRSHGCFVFLLFLWPVLAARLFWSSSVLLSAAILRCLDVAQRALSETRGWEWAASPSQGVPMVDCQSH